MRSHATSGKISDFFFGRKQYFECCNCIIVVRDFIVTSLVWTIVSFQGLQYTCIP